MASATFKIDTATLDAIRKLKFKLGATTDEEVIQKALALARVASDNADPDSNVTISSGSGGTTVNLRG